MNHTEPHPFAGKTVKIKKDVTPYPGSDSFGGEVFRLRDWWDRVSGGQSWLCCKDNMACVMYAVRSGIGELPTDDEVVYGKIGTFGHLVHVSELDLIEKN